MLFTVYVHYNVTRKKMVLFYIHRLGSEHPSSAEVSSRNIKTRVRCALSFIADDPNRFNTLIACPFLAQLPTITSSVIFWTETLHKERLSMWKKEDEAKVNIASVDVDVLHNVSRYTHSYVANIKILQQTLDFVRAEHIWFAEHIGTSDGYNHSPWFETTSDCLSSQCFQIQVILTWTEEVLERTRNLINLVCRKLLISPTCAYAILRESNC